MIAIIDYGMGNLYSVANALKKLDVSYCITNDIEKMRTCDGLILPGVGAFYDCMQTLKANGLDTFIKEEVQKGKPLLGICLGMQILFEKGYEVQECDGLGLFKGNVVLMQDTSVKIPHMGWNLLKQNKQDCIYDTLQKQPYVYYVHSYYANNYDENDVIGYSLYGNLKIVGYIRKNNVFGMQFHPEKSGEEGLKMLQTFCAVCK